MSTAENAESAHTAESAQAVCPRCAGEEIAALAHSPVPGVWTMLQCARCGFIWRTTEPARRSRREHYPESFRMTEADLADAPEVPAVPPLETR